MVQEIHYAAAPIGSRPFHSSDTYLFSDPHIRLHVSCSTCSMLDGLNVLRVFPVALSVVISKCGCG